MHPKIQRPYEWLLLALLAIGIGLMTVGAAGLVLPGTSYFTSGVAVAALGLVVTTAAAVVSVPVRMLHRASDAAASSEQNVYRRYWDHLKSATILLNFLVLLALIALLTAVTVNLGLVANFVHLSNVIRIVSLLMFFIGLTIAYVHFVSLRVPLEGAGTRPTSAPVIAGMAVSLVLGGINLALSLGKVSVGNTTLGAFDAPYFLLLGACAAAATLTSARSLPTLLVFFRGDQHYYRGRTYFSQRKSIFLPSLIALSLLFLVLLILVLFGAGPTQIQRPSQVGATAFMVIALLGSIFASVHFARSADQAALYKVKANAETRLGLTILYSSLSLAALLLVIALALRQGYESSFLPSYRWVDLLAVALLVGLGPYGFYLSYRHHKIRKLEERFPDLLRDIAASHRGGLTLSNSVSVAARGEYGTLTPEVVTMADQLSWSVPFDESLSRLSDRVKTPLIERTTSLIIEASRSGGNTTDILLAASHDAREIKNLEIDRRSTMGVYTIIVYVTFFVFLTVAALLYGSFVPVLIESGEAASKIGGGTGFAGISFDLPSLQQYRDFYFLAALVQAIGNGLVAGLMGSGRVVEGLRHAFVMVLASLVLFTLVIGV